MILLVLVTPAEVIIHGLHLILTVVIPTLRRLLIVPTIVIVLLEHIIIHYGPTAVDWHAVVYPILLASFSIVHQVLVDLVGLIHETLPFHIRRALQRRQLLLARPLLAVVDAGPQRVLVVRRVEVFLLVWGSPTMPGVRRR